MVVAAGPGGPNWGPVRGQGSGGLGSVTRWVGGGGGGERGRDWRGEVITWGQGTGDGNSPTVEEGTLEEAVSGDGEWGCCYIGHVVGFLCCVERWMGGI